MRYLPLFLAGLMFPGPALAAIADLRICASNECTVVDNESFGAGNQPREVEVNVVGSTLEFTSTFDGMVAATASATAFGRVGLGSLHAATDLTVNVVANRSARVFIGGTAEIEYSDSVRVLSASLPTGTPVTLVANMPISGGGRGAASLAISTLEGSTFRSLGGDADTAGGVFDTIESLSTTFEAMVGQLLRVEMTLAARVSCAPCILTAPATADSTFTQVSNYGSSAYLYLAALDPSLGITFSGTGGYDYLQPAPVPLPGSAAFLGAALLALRWPRTSSRRLD